MKTVQEDLDEGDTVDMGSRYLMCLVEIYQKVGNTTNNKRIFGLVVSTFIKTVQCGSRIGAKSTAYTPESISWSTF